MSEQEKATSTRDSQRSDHGLRPLIIYGGGGHGKSIIELVQAMNVYTIAGVIDDGLPQGSEVMGFPVIGGTQNLEGLFSKGIHLAVNAVGGIGDIEIRIRIFENLREVGFDFPTLIHPRAMIEPSAVVAPGVQVFPHVYVGTHARIGFGVLLNTGVIVSHDCLIGDFAGLAPGAVLAGEVKVGEKVQIGMGVTVNLGLSIGEGALIGNSAVVKSDVPAGTIVHAGEIWPARSK
jgi:acetyltransferase EpsM